MTAALSYSPASHHEAYFWNDEDRFLAVAAAFVDDGVALGEPVMVALPAPRLRRLRERLAPVAEGVSFVAMTEPGRNPARILPAWSGFVKEHAGLGRTLRGIGEPIWGGRRAEGRPECQLHEALLNLAAPPPVPLWLLCTYDLAGLPASVLAEAQRSHPEAGGVVDRLAAGRHQGTQRAEPLFCVDLPPAQALLRERQFDGASLRAVKAEVLDEATRAGVEADRAADLVLGVHEVATNSVVHGSGGGVLRIWRAEGALVCEVRDRGHIDDPLVGRRAPSVHRLGGRGLWMTNQLCDLVQIRSHAAGTTVRIHTWL